MRKLLYHDNVVLRTLASLSAVYYEYISLCSQYDIKDPLSSRMYIRESFWNAYCNRVFWYFLSFRVLYDLLCCTCDSYRL